VANITISYRREDSGVIAGRIFDRLAAHYGEASVFRDIDNVPPGIDYRKYIDGALDRADILLAIVGPQWSGKTTDGRTRITEPTDLVRLEVETALRKDIPVVPVLVANATMPGVHELPDALKDFTYRNAVKVDAFEDFDDHVKRLIRSLDRLLESQTKLPAEEAKVARRSAIYAVVPRWRVIAGGAIALGMIAFFAVNVWRAWLPSVMPQPAPSVTPQPAPSVTPQAAPSVTAQPAPLVSQQPAPPVTSQDASALYTQANNLLKGLGRSATSQDYAKARDWYEKAADGGNPDAMFKLGVIYQNGQGVALDYAKAREWYEKAADSGNADAMANLGWLYAHGQGVALDSAKAREWYEKAVAKDNAPAMFHLGYLYDTGFGVPQDYAKAREWYEKAADKGNASAMANLGLLYANGRGVPQDYAKAREWYEKAADNGNAPAMVSLGLLYENGKGVPQDYAKAREWYEKAAAKDNADAKTRLQQLPVR
jgi:TPR repeat protein